MARWNYEDTDPTGSKHDAEVEQIEMDQWQEHFENEQHVCLLGCPYWEGFYG